MDYNKKGQEMGVLKRYRKMLFNQNYMKILVTGGTGCVGREICRSLLERGHTPIPFSRSLNGDITSIDSVRNAFPVDGVIHAAAVKRCQPTHQIIDININGTKNVLDVCKSHNPKFVRLISSSEACYPVGSSIYGASKLLMEELGKEYSQFFHVECVRLPTVFGSEASLLDFWIEQAKRNKPIDLYLFDGQTKKKFFITKEEAGDYCANLDTLELGSTHHPMCKVIDVSILAKVIADMFDTTTTINHKNAKGFSSEKLSEDCCSANVSPISYEETKLLLDDYIT